MSLLNLAFPAALQRQAARVLARTGDAGREVAACVLSAAAIAGYALAPDLRPLALQALCLVQVLAFVALKPAQALVTGLGSISLLLILYCVMAVQGRPDFDPRVQALMILPACFVLGLLTLQSRRFASARDDARAGRQQLQAAQAEVERILRHDPLTGLFNRPHMQAVLQRECARVARSGSGFCVALLDVDHFRQINDVHGQQVGDDALAALARCATRVLRETDVIGRWGGAEFLVLLSDTAAGEQGCRALERLRVVIEQARLLPDRPSLRLCISAGVAVYAGGETPDRLLERAGRALQAAKAQGRNRCVLD